MFNLSYQQWQKYESGKSRIPAVVLHRFACILKTDVKLFLADPDEDGMEGTAQVGLQRPQAIRMLALFNALRQHDQEMLLALAARLADKNADVEPEDACVAAVEPDPKPAPRIKRILLVDDDEDALHVTGMMLFTAGFGVSLASGGDKALSLLTTSGPFDVLVTDYAMPGLNGAALVELALEREPDLRALVITGYATDGGLRNLPPRVEILAKPFMRIDLIQRVQYLLSMCDSCATVASDLRMADMGRASERDGILSLSDFRP